MLDRTVAIREIDTVLAALVDIKPMADYGVVGSYDTVQARRQKALAKAEQSLLNLRRELSDAHGVEGLACMSCDCSTPVGKAADCKWGWECQAWRDARRDPSYACGVTDHKTPVGQLVTAAAAVVMRADQLRGERERPHEIEALARATRDVIPCAACEDHKGCILSRECARGVDSPSVVAYYDPTSDRVVTASQMDSMLNHQGQPGKSAARTYTVPLCAASGVKGGSDA